MAAMSRRPPRAVTPTASARTRAPEIRALSGIRGIPVLLIVLFHYHEWNGPGTRPRPDRGGLARALAQKARRMVVRHLHGPVHRADLAALRRPAVDALGGGDPGRARRGRRGRRRASVHRATGGRADARAAPQTRIEMMKRPAALSPGGMRDGSAPAQGGRRRAWLGRGPVD